MDQDIEIAHPAECEVAVNALRDVHSFEQQNRAIEGAQRAGEGGDPAQIAQGKPFGGAGERRRDRGRRHDPSPREPARQQGLATSGVDHAEQSCPARIVQPRQPRVTDRVPAQAGQQTSVVVAGRAHCVGSESWEARIIRDRKS
jgi:hypothetical protein